MTIQPPIFQDHPHQITTIDTHYMRTGLAASHLIIEGQQAAFIDIGTNFSVPHFLAVLELKGLTALDVSYVIVTHVHLDHAGGAGKAMEVFPNAKLVVHPRGARHLIDPSKLVAGALEVYGEETLQAHYGDILPIPAERVIQAEDNFELNFNGRMLRFLDSPGHARHHFCVFDERSRSFFTGDAFGLSYREFDTDNGSFIFAPTTPVQFEPMVWHDTINKLMRYQPEAMYLTHYGRVDNVEVMAEKLHQSIDQMVLLMESVIEEELDDDVAGRVQSLTEQIIRQLLSQLVDHGCVLPETQCRNLLKVDAELNAQGLVVWWEKGG